MKRPSYKSAIEWIAMNDDDGDEDSLDPTHVCGQITAVLVADMF